MEQSVLAKDMCIGDTIRRWHDGSPVKVLSVDIKKDNVGCCVMAKFGWANGMTELWWSYDQSKSFSLISRE